MSDSMDEREGVFPADPEDEDIRGGPPGTAEPEGAGEDPGWDDPPAVPARGAGDGSDIWDDGGEEEAGAQEEDPAAAMARPEERVRKKKEKKEKKPKAPRAPGGSVLEKLADAAANRKTPAVVETWRGMSEPARQALFACGCATAGFCLIILLVFCTVLAFRMFRPSATPVLAKPSGDGAYYYDGSGKPHVNVYITSPEEKAVVYVHPDGTVSSEPPEAQDQEKEDIKTVVLYVDADGNVSDEPPEKRDPEPEQAVLYMDADGALSTEKPAGPWREVTVTVGNDGRADIADTGKSDDWDAAAMRSDASKHMAPSALYRGQDGHLYVSDPGGGDKFEITVGDGGESEIAPVPAPDPEPAIAEEPAPDPEPAVQEGGNGTYLIQWGDTLSGLSSRFGFPVDFLADYNHIRNKDLIFAGENLYYPAGNP